MVGSRNSRHREQHRSVNPRVRFGTYSCLRMARRKQVYASSEDSRLEKEACARSSRATVISW